MIDATILNQHLVELVTKKVELDQLDYNDERYDDIEEALHDLEDDFNEEFGDYLEEVLEEVHGDIKSDTDVLLPTAYLPNAFEANKEDGKFGEDDGVLIDSEKYPNRDARLVLLPNPARLVLLVNRKPVEELWKA